MKTRISLVNAAIELKKDNGKNGYNFYEWIAQVKKDLRPDLTVSQIWEKVTLAYISEMSCCSQIPLR